MRRIVVVVILAVTAALAGSTLAYRAIAAHTAAPVVVPKVMAPVAARDLPAGTLLQPSDVQLVDWPVALNPQWVSTQEAVAGRGVVANIYKGEPFLESRLAPKGSGAGLTAGIPAGMRAVAVRVDEVMGGSGFVSPGMRVDVLSTGAPPGSSSTITRTVLQNITVLPSARGVERDARGLPAPVPVVNLLVTPEQAETLIAAGQTKLQLVARNPIDGVLVTTHGISNDRLLGGDGIRTKSQPAAPRSTAPAKAVPVAETVAAPLTVDVFTGTKKSSVVVGQIAAPRLEESK